MTLRDAYKQLARGADPLIAFDLACGPKKVRLDHSVVVPSNLRKRGVDGGHVKDTLGWERRASGSAGHFSQSKTSNGPPLLRMQPLVVNGVSEPRSCYSGPSCTKLR